MYPNNYNTLYNAIENTAIQNTAKLLYIRQYYIQPSHHTLSVCHIDCIFYGMVWDSYETPSRGMPWNCPQTICISWYTCVYTKKIQVVYHLKALHN